MEKRFLEFCENKIYLPHRRVVALSGGLIQ